MGFFKPLDYFAWASELDVVSTDNYVDPADPEWPMHSAMHYDLVRSLNKDVALDGDGADQLRGSTGESATSPRLPARCGP